MEETQYQLDDLDGGQRTLSKRLDRVERALHALLENPGSIFAGAAAAREILNSEL
jgi:hypothetical protein